jgi:hypothetical protein
MLSLIANATDSITQEELSSIPLSRVFVYEENGKLWGCDALELLFYLSEASVDTFPSSKMPQTGTRCHRGDMERLYDQVCVIDACDLPADVPERSKEELRSALRAYMRLLDVTECSEAYSRHHKKLSDHALDLYELWADQDDDTRQEVIELLDSKRKRKAVPPPEEGSAHVHRPRKLLRYQKPEFALFTSALASMHQTLQTAAAFGSSP